MDTSDTTRNYSLWFRLQNFLAIPIDYKYYFISTEILPFVLILSISKQIASVNHQVNPLRDCFRRPCEFPRVWRSRPLFERGLSIQCDNGKKIEPDPSHVADQHHSTALAINCINFVCPLQQGNNRFHFSILFFFSHKATFFFCYFIFSMLHCHMLQSPK